MHAPPLEHDDATEQVRLAGGFERGIRRDGHSVDGTRIVDVFQTIDDRPAHDCTTPDVLLDLRVRLHPANGHGKIDLDRVAALPYTPYDHETIGRLHVDRLAVDRRGCPRAPAGNAKPDGKLVGVLRLDDDPHFALPRVAGFLRDLHLALLEWHRSGTAHILQHADSAAVRQAGIHVIAQCCHVAHHVRRTAGTAVPRLAVVVAATGQRVHVEELRPIKRDARQRAVVEDAFDKVGEPPFPVQERQPVVPERDADRGARLAVGVVVRQVILAGETLPVALHADAAGDVHLISDDVLPQPLHGVDVPRIAVKRGQIGHRTVEVQKTDRVTDRLRLLGDRQVVLAILAEEPVRLGLSVLVDEEPGQLQVAVFAGRPPELDQGQLDLFMPGHGVPLAGPEDGVDVIGEPAGHVEKRPLVRGAEMGDRGLEHVPGTVQFVRVLQVGPALVRFLHREPRIHVTVRLLRAGDEVDDLVQPRFELLVGMRDERVGHAFEHLVDVGIVKDVPGERRLVHAGGLREVANPARLLAHLDVVRNRDLAVGLLPGRPEVALDLDAAETDGRQFALRLRTERHGRCHHQYCDPGASHHANPRSGNGCVHSLPSQRIRTTGETQARRQRQCDVGKQSRNGYDESRRRPSGEHLAAGQETRYRVEGLQ